jgi:sulfonate transport system ATP-binding protein
MSGSNRALAVTARGVSKSFGARRVLSNLDLYVPPGQFVAVVGRSGCGKSTLLRLLAGLETPDGGRLQIAGDDPRAEVRLMFQEPRLLPWETIAANVAVGLGRAADKKEARSAALAALRDVGLDDRAGVWPSTLSGGQKQRVALARALVSKPGLLALDEPLGALDALTRIEMQSLIRDVTRRERFTAVLVTHDVSEAVALADRVLLLEDGIITLDTKIDLPDARRRGTPESAAIEAQILGHLLDHDRSKRRAA